MVTSHGKGPSASPCQPRPGKKPRTVAPEISWIVSEKKPGGKEYKKRLHGTDFCQLSLSLIRIFHTTSSPTSATMSQMMIHSKRVACRTSSWSLSIWNMPFNTVVFTLFTTLFVLLFLLHTWNMPSNTVVLTLFTTLCLLHSLLPTLCTTRFTALSLLLSYLTPGTCHPTPRGVCSPQRPGRQCRGTYLCV